MDITDSHCHLHFADYDNDRERVIKHSAAAGVSRIINVGTSLEDSQKAVDLAAKYRGMWATVGVHPNDSADFTKDSGQTARFNQLLKSPKVVAIGEIGLDYYHDRTPKDVQEKILRWQLEQGLTAGLPFVFHIREAFEGFWPIFDYYHSEKTPVKGVIHSFSAPPNVLVEALKRGLYIGLNGLITYARDNSWRESARQAPLGSILLETDAPFLTPAPEQGQRCEPRHTAATAEFLAKLRGEPLEKLAQATTDNTMRLFGLNPSEKLLND